MINDENANNNANNNTEQSGENAAASELRRRRNATRSEGSAEEQRETANTARDAAANGARDEHGVVADADQLSEPEQEEQQQQQQNDQVQQQQHVHLVDEGQNGTLELDADQFAHSSSTNTDTDSDEIVNVARKKPTVFEYFCMEVSRRYSLQNEKEQYAEKRRKVYAFLRIPVELEKFIYYGFRQCLDAFCHTFTILPIRVLFNLFACSFRLKRWSAADTCDILKLIIIFCASWFMQFVDTSVVYHIVRGQGIIKLYIFYNMLEVADKLFSSFGQDIFDALLWTASERGTNKKFISTVFHLTVAIIYAVCHTLVILLQATTLNVAFNSHNQSLLTIMMSNNFVELKGAVFKKFGKPNLFQMSCSDVRERFLTIILLVVVVLRNMTAVNWKLEHLNDMTPDLMMIIFAEHIVDWLKHAFITKFNEISAFVYREYTITIAYDVLRTHETDSFSDFSDQVSRRMGFVPIPVVILLIRVICQSVDFENPLSVAALVFAWFMLLVTKIFNGASLYSKAFDQVARYRASANVEAQVNLDESTRLFPSMFPL
ncbi:hypothetical protein niasHS_018187 [Heterodera schachtii]|uniref:Protein TAPT1 homolog n=1 Tax=Heterodera schachtii TaxID=97005 RepID=A0ABD2HSK4_HETSC